MSTLARSLGRLAGVAKPMAASAIALPSASSLFAAAPARAMSHNPKYMREHSSHESKFMEMREKLLTGDSIQRKPRGAARRRGTVIYSAETKPAAIGIHMTPHIPNVETWVENMSGERVAIVDLNPSVWNADTSRVDFVQRVVEWQRAKRRQGTHKSLGRSEVHGSGKKKFAQKGTGRARVSDRLAPQFYHGGHAFPHRPRNHAFALPIAIRRRGLMTVLSAKRAEQRLHFIDAARVPNHKTKDLANRLAFFGSPEGRTVLIHGDGELDANLALASRNIAHFDMVPARGANVLDLLSARSVIVTLSAKMDLESRLMRRSRRINFGSRLIRLLPTATAAAKSRARAVARIAAVRAYNKKNSAEELTKRKEASHQWIQGAIERRKAKDANRKAQNATMTEKKAKKDAITAAIRARTAAKLLDPVTVVAAEKAATA